MDRKNWITFTIICVGLIFFNLFCVEVLNQVKVEQQQIRIAKAIELAPKIARLEEQLITEFTTTDAKKYREEVDINVSILKKIDALRNK